MNVECYEIRANGEWGTFFVRQGFIPKGEQSTHDRYWCELTCNTSFGCVGYHWGHMGRPAAQFLATCNHDYVGTKLWGAAAQVFDGGAAMRDAFSFIIRDRRDGNIEKHEARERWDDLAQYSRHPEEHEFISLVHATDWLYEWAMDGGLNDKTDNPQMVGFFRDLWPVFLAEMAAAKQAQAA